MNSCIVRTLMLSALTAVIASASAADGIAPSIGQKGDTLTLTHDGVTMPVSLKSPVFEFEGVKAGGTSAKAAIGDELLEGRTVTVKYAPVPLTGGASLDVAVKLKWSARESLLRKWAAYRVIGGGPVLLNEITLDNIAIKGTRVWTHGDFTVIPDAVQSHPIFIPGFYAGIEFPVSAARVDGETIILGHRPGLRLQPGTWYETRKAVYGVAPKGEEISAFERYIASHRPKPRNIHLNYNSWWTSSVPFSEKEIVGLIGTFDTEMYKPYKAAFDTFCIDLGWSNPKSVWEINRELFPQEFKGIQAAAAKMDSRLGLWISPSSCYSPMSVDNKWAMDHGYEATLVNGAPYVLCLGGPRYAAQFRNRLADMITKFGIEHIKLDGIWLTCDQPGHGHELGLRSSEKIAEGFIAACEAMRKAAPNVWLEPTCFGYNPSPWWLFQVNSLIGTFGDDAPRGRLPAPVARESYTTARDYFNLQGASLLPFPIAAQEVLGIIHQSPDPFMNDAVTSILRGHMFQPIYMNPKYMNEARWKSFAGLLKWVRKNSPKLQTTEPLLPASWVKGKTPHFTDGERMPAESYGFAHGMGDRGLVMLRNPWMAESSYTIKLDRSLGFAAGDKTMSAVSIYPEPRVYARALHYGDSLNVPLAPYETVVLSIQPGQPKGKLPEVSDSINKQITASVSRKDFARANFATDIKPFGADWTSIVGSAESVVRMNLEAEVTSNAPDNQVLVLLEGDIAPMWADCRISVDGKEVHTEQSGSATAWSATGLSTPENWVFIKANLPKGKSSVSINLMADTAYRRVSAWVWATKPGLDTTHYPNAIPSPELISLDSLPLLDVTNADSPSHPVVTEARPIERINGAFLDAIDPVSVTQGYGKLERNQSVWEKPMIIAGKRYMRGLGTHSVARIEYALDGKYKRFLADAGVDGNNSGTVTFEVWVDGVKKLETSLMQRDDPAKEVDIDVTGAKSLVLVVGDGGNGIGGDHADWGNARLLF